MAITLIGTPISARSADGISVTSAGYSNISGATAVIVVVVDYAGGLASNLTDSVNGATGWVQDVILDFGSAYGRVQVWSNLTGTFTNGITFTAAPSSGSSYPDVFVWGFTGIDSFDNHTGQIDSGVGATSTSPGPIDPSTPDDLIISGFSEFPDISAAAISPGTIPSGFVLTNTGVNTNGAAAYEIRSGDSSPSNPTWTWTTNAIRTNVVQALYQPASAGASTGNFLGIFM